MIWYADDDVHDNIRLHRMGIGRYMDILAEAIEDWLDSMYQPEETL